MQTPEQPVPEELSPDDLVLLIDGLLRSGTQHLHLAVGEKTSVQTVNSTECCENGAEGTPGGYEPEGSVCGIGLSE